ncbi:MAG: ribonuclease P protein component [Patescibacteria group bacterium]|jgi:ribonuclease P protein component|nr:ribonuclease P protein component [Patescibacteria group bacterium]MDD5172575.1 ribonuclease P protein component [Patescibacteria group bacterium]
MLPKKYRLVKNNDFARVAQKGKMIFGQEVSLKWIKNDLNYSRFGITVSLKVDKRAVMRNKIKRRIRAILKKYLLQFVLGYDFLILTRPKIKELDFQQIESAILKIFKKGGLIQ